VSGTDGGPSLSGPGPDPGAPGQVTTRVSISPQGATFTVDPGRLKPGEKVYITTSTGAVSTIAMAVAKAKPALPCPPAP
jgi:hypothetical protein